MLNNPTDRARGRITRPLIDQLRSDAEGTQWRGRERAEQIVDVAMSLFHDNGYNATSMDEIAQAVGILKGSLYHYIDSKEDLLYLICSKVRDTAESITEEALSRTDLSPLERVLHYLSGQVAFNAVNSVQIAVYNNEWKRLSGAYFDEMKRRRDENMALFRAVLADASEAGELAPNLNLDLAVRHVFGVAAYTYTWYRPDGPITIGELTAFSVRAVRRALAADPRTNENENDPTP